jgi:hypothetical protein
MATKTDKKKGKKKAAAAVNVSLATFDHCVTRPVYRRLRRGALGAFPQVGPGEYQPYGMTPLRDAVAEFIRDLDELRADDAVTVGLLLDESGSMADKRDAVIQGVNEFVEGLRSEKDVDPDAAGKVLAVITTDGLENRSREVSVEQLQDMIEAREADGWTFIFLGAKQDAWATGTSYGLSGTVSGQTVSTQDSPAGTLAALREGAGRTASYLGDQAKFRSTYSAQSANTVLSEDGKLSVNESQNATPTPGPKRAKPKSEPYGDVADALERAASATRSPGAS